MTTQQLDAGTKQIQFRISAKMLVDFMEVVEVPADITEAELEDELSELINQRYQNVDVGRISYWNTAEKEEPTLKITRDHAGFLSAELEVGSASEHIPTDLEDDLQGLTEFFSVPEPQRADVIRRLRLGQPTPELPGARLVGDEIIVAGVLTLDGQEHQTDVSLRTGFLLSLDGLQPPLEDQHKQPSPAYFLQVGGHKAEASCMPIYTSTAVSTAWYVPGDDLLRMRGQILQRHPQRFGVVLLDSDAGPNGSELVTPNPRSELTAPVPFSGKGQVCRGAFVRQRGLHASRRSAVRVAQYLYEHKLFDGTVVVVDRGIDDKNPKRTIVFQLSRKA